MEVEINGKKFEVKPHQTILDNQKSEPYLDKNDVAITRDESKCIGCSLCRVSCLENNNLGIPTPQNVDGCIYFRPDGKLEFEDSKCTRCGQCILSCPTGALSEREYIEEVRRDLVNPNKIVVAQVAPSVRVSLAESFGMIPGSNLEGEIVAGLKKLGFDYVFDVNLGADFTTFEEAFDLMDRLKEKETPMFTSCCPARVKFIEDFHPEFINNITTVRSPQECLAALIKSYFAKKKNIDPKKISVVSIMPCVAKKFEMYRSGEDKTGTRDVDWVLTTREFIKMLKSNKIDLAKIEPVNFDQDLGVSSGAGAIYGASGGVMESAVRTFAYIVTGQKIGKIDYVSSEIPRQAKLDYEELRGMEGIKKATIKVGKLELKIAVTSGLANAEKIMDEIKKGEVYHYVEVMACPGGCVGGGGQPKPATKEIIDTRRKALYEIDKDRPIRTAHENPILEEVYKEFLGCPGSKTAKKYLHTNYDKKQARICKI